MEADHCESPWAYYSRLHFSTIPPHFCAPGPSLGEFLIFLKYVMRWHSIQHIMMELGPLGVFGPYRDHTNTSCDTTSLIVIRGIFCFWDLIPDTSMIVSRQFHQVSESETTVLPTLKAQSIIWNRISSVDHSICLDRSECKHFQPETRILLSERNWM